MTLMRNGRDRRLGKPGMGHATLERVFLFGTRSADHIRASGHSGCVVMGPVLHSKTGRIHGCTRTLRGNVKFFLHRGRRPYMAHHIPPATSTIIIGAFYSLGKLGAALGILFIACEVVGRLYLVMIVIAPSTGGDQSRSPSRRRATRVQGIPKTSARLFTFT
jgi:hypothetical protein